TRPLVIDVSKSVMSILGVCRGLIWSHHGEPRRSGQAQPPADSYIESSLNATSFRETGPAALAGRHAGVKVGIRHDGTPMKVSCAEPGRRISSVRPLVASGGPGDVIGPALRALVARLSQAALFRD